MTDNSLKEKSFKELETYSYIINIPFQCAVLNYSQRREEKKKTEHSKTTAAQHPGDGLGMRGVSKVQFNLLYSKSELHTNNWNLWDWKP